MRYEMPTSVRALTMVDRRVLSAGADVRTDAYAWAR